MSILLLPLDVANRAACSDSIVLSACNFALPMRDLWYAVYMTMFVVMALVIPFTIFYYEQDHDTGVYGKVISSASWGFGTFTVIALILGLCYGFVGYVDLPVSTLVSGLGAGRRGLPLRRAQMRRPRGAARRVSGLRLRRLGDSISETWSVRTTSSRVRHRSPRWFRGCETHGVCGVGVSAIPVDEIKAFLARPKKVIAKSEYIRIAGKIAEETKSVLEEAREVQREERARGGTGKAASALAKIEEATGVARGRRAHPPANVPAARRSRRAVDAHSDGVLWTPRGGRRFRDRVHGVDRARVRVRVSGSAAGHVPEWIFRRAGLGVGALRHRRVRPLLLLSHPVRGEGVREGWVSAAHLHRVPDETRRDAHELVPLQRRLIMLSSVAVIQFCTRAFDGYAAETSVSDIFGGEIENLRGLGILFKEQVFLYCFFACAGLAAIALVASEARESRKPRRAFESI